SWAAGALYYNGAGTPLKWASNPIPYNTDMGIPAGVNISGDFGVWGAIGSANIAFTNAGAITACANGDSCSANFPCSDLSACSPVDVTVSNYGSFIGICDGLSPIIWDADGSIMEDFFGPGAGNSVVAFAAPDCMDFNSATFSEGYAILNGKFVDGISNGSNPEISLLDFNAAIIHEIGHYLNLDNSQINLTEAGTSTFGD